MYGDLKTQCNCLTVKSVTIISLLLITFISCKNGSEKHIVRSGPGRDEMVDLNRYLIQKDKERIKNYIERKNLKMTESSTGLWYQILKNGEGSLFKDNNKVVFSYDCYLLDGTKCYSSKDLGVKEVVLGKSEMEAGMNEGLRMLNEGAEAIFIMPPFLAYGLIGDGKKIPPRATIVYKISVLPVK